MNNYSTQLPGDARRLETAVRRIFPTNPLQIERVREGVSTYVYRIISEQQTYYLRILPEEDASFAPEAAVHTRLLSMQVKVPAVIHFEPYNDLLQRSIMVTAEIKGRPISQSPELSHEQLTHILREAGRDLARINSIPVAGFGWIARNAPEETTLTAPWPTYRAFVGEFWRADLAFLRDNAISAAETSALERILSQHDSWLKAEQATLAHGDFDTTQIYQANGHYSGIIDFGEIRGANRCYDLGHFHMRDGELLPQQLQPLLVRGYSDILPLPQDHEQRIRFTALLINVRALAHNLQKRPPNRFTAHQLHILRKDIANLSNE